MENTFVYAAPIAWNPLPIQTRALTNFEKFKSTLKPYLFQLPVTLRTLSLRSIKGS